MPDMLVNIIMWSSLIGIIWWIWFLGATVGLAPDKNTLTVLDIIMMIVFLPVSICMSAILLVTVLFFWLKELVTTTIFKW